MRNVLMILYQFPPCNDVGAFRPVKFIKYLKQYGWIPVVLAPSNALYASYDDQKEKSIKGVCRVYRTPLLNPFEMAVKKSKRTSRSYKFIWKILNRILLPDVGLLWMLPAVKKGLKIFKKEKIDLIFVSGQPFSTFIIAGWLKKLTGKPLVLDYRDPWTLNPFHKGSRFGLMVERKIEKSVLQQADAALFTTPEARERQNMHFSNQITSENLYIVTNSFEPAGVNPFIASGKEYKIIHAGNLYGNRNPAHFFKGLALAVKQDAELNHSVKVEFYGVADYTQYAFVLDQLDIRDKVTFEERIPFDLLFEKLRTAGALLLLNSFGKGHDVFVPAKFFDYLKADRPILCLAEDGALKNIMEVSKSGLVVDPQDSESIGEAILRMFRQKADKITKNECESRQTLRRQFESQHTTKRLAVLFNRIS